MRIVLLSAFYEPFVSGAERMVVETVRRLAGRFSLTVVTARLDAKLPRRETKLIEVSGLRGKGRAALLKAPLQLCKALLQARQVVREVRPVCVLGMGGYVTGPGGLAARLAGVPLIIHEQNAVAGTANRLLARFAARICEAFPNTFARSAKRRTTGNPVRAELFLDQPRAPLAGRAANLLVLGGSLGAEPLNKLVPAALSHRGDRPAPGIGRPVAPARSRASGGGPPDRLTACRDHPSALC